MTRVRVFGGRVKALGRDPNVLAGLGGIADAAAEEMAGRAPRRTGAGAHSIRAQADPGLPGFRVSWDRDHFYMSFHELGTNHQPARPFARPVADEINRSRS